MFHTPSRPVMYLPEYNAVLVPAGARVQSVKPSATPPRRRRPLADLIRFIQGKNAVNIDDIDENSKSNQDESDPNGSMTEKEHEQLLESMRELVRIGVIDNVQIVSQPKNGELRNFEKNTGRSYPHGTSYSYRQNGLSNLNERNPSEIASSSSTYIFDDRFPESNSGRSYYYSYKYVIPKSNANKSTQVHVQQKSIVGMKPILNYYSPRPELQQAIDFLKLPRVDKIDQHNLNKNVNNTLRKGSQQQRRNNQQKLKDQQNESEDEKKVIVKFDNKHGSLSEIKVNTRTKPMINTNENKNGSDNRKQNLQNTKNIENIQDIPIVQVETHTRKQIVHIMDANSMKSLANKLEQPSNIIVTDKNNESNENVQLTSNNDNNENVTKNFSPRILIKERSSSNDGLHEEMIIMTGRKPSELVLNPIARAIAGPSGVAIAAPIAKAVLRPGEDVMLQFDPDSVAIAGPGGRAHSHPKFIISYMNHTKPN